MSSSITLSSAVRSNLLSLQNTATLTATTQNRLSTGKRVSSALDSPVNFFTAQSLSNRSSDLGALLDGVSNGIQAIQAATQGITAIQRLVDAAKSVASQALASRDPRTDGVASSDFELPVYADPIDHPIGHPILQPVVVEDDQTFAQSETGQTDRAQAYDRTDREEVVRVSRYATTVGFTVDGSRKSIDLTDTDTVDTAVDKLNAAAGRTLFSADAGRIAVHGTGAVAFDDDEGAKLGFAADGADLTVEDKARTSLRAQFTTLLKQIDQVARDASYNGIDLIGSGADTNRLHITFNEKGTSGLDVRGVDLTSGGLGLTQTGSFQADAGIGAAITRLTTASGVLRAQASTLGSNLSVVKTRQDFSQRLVGVLDSGAARLTGADLDEEAANTQALATRRSLGISALSLAGTAQRGILSLLA